MPNHRSDCPFCKTTVLTRDRGLHYLRKHKEKLFIGENLKRLHSSIYVKKPLKLRINSQEISFCLGDQTCFSRPEFAEKHLKDTVDAHTAALTTLREEYPLKQAVKPEETNETVQRSTAASSSELREIQNDLAELLGRLRTLEAKTGVEDFEAFDFCPKAIRGFTALGLIIKDDELKEIDEFAGYFPGGPKPEEPQEDTLETPDYDEKLFDEEKPMTKDQALRQTITEEDITKLSTCVVTKRVNPRVEAELRQMISPRRSAPAPVPVIIPSPASEAEIAHMETVTKMEVFQKMSPWERFVKMNQDLPAAELARQAQEIGICPP